MEDKEIFRAIDGLMAYDTGCVDSGIHDEELRSQLIQELVRRGKLEKNKYRLYPQVIDKHLLQMLNGEYSTEDVKDTIAWIDEMMDTCGCDVGQACAIHMKFEAR